MSEQVICKHAKTCQFSHRCDHGLKNPDGHEKTKMCTCGTCEFLPAVTVWAECVPVEPVQMMICSGATVCKSRCRQHGYAHFHHDDCDETQEFASDCPACVPVEQPATEPPASSPVDLDAIRQRVVETDAGDWSAPANERAREMCSIVIDEDAPALCNEVERLRRDLAALRNTAMILERQRDSMRHDRNVAEVDCAKAQLGMRDAREKRDELREELRNYKVRYAQMNTDMRAAVEERDAAQAAYEETSEKLRLALIERGQARAGWAHTTDTLGVVTDALTALKSERDELRGHWAESLDISGALAEDVISMTYERDELQAEIKRLCALIALAAYKCESLNCGEVECEALVDEVNK